MKKETSREDALRLTRYLGCTGVHQHDGQWMPCSSHEELMKISERAEPRKKKSKRRRRRRTGWENLGQSGLSGIGGLTGGGIYGIRAGGFKNIEFCNCDSCGNEMKNFQNMDSDEFKTDASAPPSDQIFGSRQNPKGSARSRTSGQDIKLDEATSAALRNKVKEHNEKMRAADKPKHSMATLSALKSVYRRGAGAFSTSHRPGMTRGQWAMARVNSFLNLLEKGKPKNPKYTTDYDLLPTDHPKRSKGLFGIQRKEAREL